MDDFNIICSNFQEKIVNVFNEEDNIPFLIKYYLFKDVWKTVKNKKQEIDINIQLLKKQKKKILKKEIPLDQIIKKEGEEQ